MSRKSKVSDEQLIELIEQGLNNTAIAKQLGMTIGGISVRLAQLRKRHDSLSAAVTVKAEKPKLIYADIKPGDSLVRGGRRYEVLRVNQTGLVTKTMDGLVKGISAEDIAAGDYKKVQVGDPNASPVIVVKAPIASTKDQTPITKEPEKESEKPMPITETPSKGLALEDRIHAIATAHIIRFRQVRRELLDCISEEKPLREAALKDYNQLIEQYRLNK